MQYTIDKDRLFEILAAWDVFLKRKVRLIACGGTALTLLDVKESTKDIDFLVPEKADYTYLVGILKDLGYEQKTGYGWGKGDGFLFELFPGNAIFTTTLIESPLKNENNIMVKEYTHIYLGILNYYDLLISKLFRNTAVDQDDCLMLVKAKRKDIEFDKLRNRFYKTSSYDISDERNKKNFEDFLKLLRKEGIKL